MLALKIIGVILGWIVLGFISTKLTCILSNQYSDLEMFFMITLFAPLYFPILILFAIFKGLYFIYDAIFGD